MILGLAIALTLFAAAGICWGFYVRSRRGDYRDPFADLDDRTM